jgi:nitrite reductase/ring-hydroxylating ferredoxin subunit
VARKEDLQEGSLLKVVVNDKEILLGMVEGKIYAIDNRCTHARLPLDKGSLDGFNLTCPHHFGIFDIRNGVASPETPWVKNTNSYPVKLDEVSGDVFVNFGKVGT